MYTVAVQREFIAQHFLTGGDFGPENHPHSHHYRVELRLVGGELDEHGFLADIDVLSALLEEGIGRFRDRMLNDLAEFRGVNPSIEHLCRILCRGLAAKLETPGSDSVQVTVWETPQAWAAYTTRLQCA